MCRPHGWTRLYPKARCRPVTASNWDLPEEAWVEAANTALDFIEDGDAKGLILHRFDAQYLPALRKARNAQQVWRAWNAFHHYLTTRETRRKFFCLSHEDADRAISLLTAILHLPPYQLP